MPRIRRAVPAAVAMLVVLLAATAAVARPPAIEVTGPTVTSANELVIAINPANPAELAIGANLDFHFSSLDGGTTWRESHINSSFGVWGDPCLIFDADGNLFYAHLSNPLDGNWIDRIVVQKSTDGGQSWSDGIGVGLNPPAAEDKEWLAADRTDSPYRHNIYMSWTEFDTYGSTSSLDSTRILFARSTDRGATWSSPLRISERGGNCLDEDQTVEGAVPAVGPEGQVYVAWAGHDEIRFDRSFDGGKTFGPDIHVSDQPGGWDFGIPGIYRCNGMPITACDISHSPWRGRVYVLFSDQRYGSDDTDVFLCTSDDQGTTWSVPRRVNDDVGTADQFFPWLAVDPVTGLVAVVFYDRRGLTGDETGVTIATSTDGGLTFTNTTVSDANFVPWSSSFFGDYIGIDAYGGTVCATWLAMDAGSRSVWMARLTPASGVRERTVSSLVLRTPAATAARRTTISFITYRDAPVELSIYDVRGRLVRDLISETRAAGEYRVAWDGDDRDGRSVASGMYIARLRSGPDEVTKKIVIVN